MTYTKQADFGNQAGKQKRGLAFPPVLTTNLPTTSTSAVRNHIQACIRIPNGFLDAEYANGLAVMFRVFGGDVGEDTRDRYNFALHKPVKSLTAYASGWKIIDAPYEGPTDFGLMGAQRRGQYIYGVGGQNTTGSGAFRYQFVDRFHGSYGRERRQHDNSVYFEGLGGAASGAPTDSFVYASNAEMFVSDHEPPLVWWLSGNTVGRAIDDGTPWAWHWKSEDQRGFGSGDDSLPYYETHHFRFPFWHTWQDYEAPEHALPPALVHPWSVGDYGDPQMWWFLPERLATGEFTGRLDIYRAEWKTNQYRADRGWVLLGPRWVSGDPRITGDIHVGDLVAGRATQTDTSTNTTGLAFEHNWQDHYVGTVGPFRGANFTGAATYVVKVIRDPRRTKRLILVMSSQASPGTDGWGAAWHASSPDDGTHWGRTHQIHPFLKTRDGFTGGPFADTPSVTLATSGDLLIPGVATYHDKAQQSLISVNHDDASVANADELSVFFRRGAGGK